jgi:hypothetical protein
VASVEDITKFEGSPFDVSGESTTLRRRKWQILLEF